MTTIGDPALNSNEIRLSVIIVSWNTREALARCLRSIRDHEPGRDYEIIVVDNHSTDGTVERIAEEFPWTKIISNPANVGFGAANNQAMEIARGRDYLLLNSDTVLVEETFAKMMSVLDRLPWVGAVGCRLQREDAGQQISAGPLPGFGTIFFSTFGLHRLFPECPMSPSRTVLRQTEHPLQSVGYVSGACMLLRREAVLEVGAFDPSFFLYSEEVDLCRRLAGAGWGVVYSATPTVVHLEGRSLRGATKERFVRLYSGTIRYLAKSGGADRLLLTMPLVLLHLASRLAGSGLNAKARLAVLSDVFAEGSRFALDPEP